MIRHKLEKGLQIIGILVVMGISGCARIPKQTPNLMHQNNERLMGLTRVNYHNTVFLIDQLTMIKNDLIELDKFLNNIDKTSLGEKDSEVILSIVSGIGDIRRDIEKTLVPSIIGFPDTSERTASEIISCYRIITDILRTTVDKESQIQDLLNRLETAPLLQKGNSHE